MAKRTKFSDQVRQAIDESGVTRYRIAQDTGLDESSLSKFHRGKQWLSQDAVDRLADYLGLRIVMNKKRK